MFLSLKKLDAGVATRVSINADNIEFVSPVIAKAVETKTCTVAMRSGSIIVIDMSFDDYQKMLLDVGAPTGRSL